MKKLLSLFAIALAISLPAQKGDFLLTHHSPSSSNIDNSNFQVISDNNGLICLANRTGVLKYDGKSWDYYPTPSSALSMAVDDENVIYIGGINDFGKIDFSENKVSYQSLSKIDSLEDLFLQTHYYDKKIYFLGSSHLAIYSIETQEVKLIDGDFINLFRLEDGLYINSTDDIFAIKADTLLLSDPGIQAVSVHTYENKPPLMVDFNGKLFVWEDRAKSIIQNKLIEENGYHVSEAKWINDSLIACSTFSSGVVLLNYNDADYIEAIDYHSGLPDNEIYSLHTDGRGAIWIAHPFGLTSVSPLFPAFSYSNLPGFSR